jgi:hypothetical protein
VIESAVRVTATDGSATSAPLTSASVTVINSARPYRSRWPDQTVAQGHAHRHRRGQRRGLDSVTLTYVWRVEGVIRRTVTTTATSDSSISRFRTNGSPHDEITVTVTPNDGFTDGAAATATAFVAGTTHKRRSASHAFGRGRVRGAGRRIEWPADHKRLELTECSLDVLGSARNHRRGRCALRVPTMLVAYWTDSLATARRPSGRRQPSACV